MNTTYQINRESAPMEALATAAAKALLTFAKIAISSSVNTLLALVAVICLFCGLISGQHTAMTAMATLAWVLHLAVTLTIDITKGGAGL